MKFIFFLILLSALFSLPSYSQEDEDEDEYENKEKNEKGDTLKKVTALEEIVVSGTRTEKMIIDIPYSVFRVDKKEFIYGRDLNAKDILQDVPGLFIQTRLGSEVRISIRGFGTRSNVGVRGIWILQDGIPESEPDGETNMDAIDYTSLGGVEVVKGNLSSLYPNSPGGVVNFLSDFGFTNNFLKIVGIAGNYKLFQTGFRLGLVGDNSKFYISHTYKNYAGYREHGAEYSHLVNADYIAYPGKNSSIAILGNYFRGLVRFPGALTAQEFSSDPFQPYLLAVGNDIKKITQKGRIGVKYKNTWGKLNINEFEFTGFGSIKDFEFTTNRLYNVENKYLLGSTIRYTSRHKLFKRENEFTAGIDYYFVSGPLSSYVNISGTKGDDLEAQSTQTQNNYGLYFENHLNIYTAKLYLLLSGRFDKLIFKNDDELFGTRNSKRTFERFTPKAAVNYKLTPSVSAYTSFGFGFDSPSSTELENYQFSSNNGITTLNPDLNPQTSGNFEVGIKGIVSNKRNRFFKKELFEFTFFDTRVENEIVPFIVGNNV
ncbi:MAG: TonB-dependent receptor domain-containing protein, partial [Ignavibacteria bacterium]